MRLLIHARQLIEPDGVPRIILQVLSGGVAMIYAVILAAAVFIDYLLGDPRRWHPVAAFGQCATKIERAIHPRGTTEESSSLSLRIKGTLAWILAIVPLTLVVWYLSELPYVGLFFTTLVLYFAIGAKSLVQHAQAVSSALEHHDLDEARRKVGMIVSRDTENLSDTEIVRATCESVLENGNDAIFGALFWFLLLGAPGAVLYRLANTLDAMWGYRNARYRHFGWAAARIDDALNLIPARLTALTYALVGRTRNALHCWATQAKHWYSPNAGPVMAAGAGALEIQLGGAARYHGELKQRPALGGGRAPRIEDIARAVRLVQRGLVLWVAATLAGGWFHA